MCREQYFFANCCKYLIRHGILCLLLYNMVTAGLTMGDYSNGTSTHRRGFPNFSQGTIRFDGWSNKKCKHYQGKKGNGILSRSKKKIRKWLHEQNSSMGLVNILNCWLILVLWRKTHKRTNHRWYWQDGAQNVALSKSNSFSLSPHTN